VAEAMMILSDVADNKAGKKIKIRKVREQQAGSK
jgi:hypothetical protein